MSQCQHPMHDNDCPSGCPNPDAVPACQNCGDTDLAESSGLCLPCLDARDGRCRECHGQGTIPWSDGSGRHAPCDWCHETGETRKAVG